MEENLPPGFRFHPTDEELITYYLSNKVSDFDFKTRAIADVDLNKCEPWDLPAKASMGEKEWYFFSLKDRKYPTGLRTNRATEAGYWKTTGKDKEIFGGGVNCSSSSVLVGMKKTLVFYRGRAPKGEKTNWVMHEYRLETNLAFKQTKEEWVVCRVFQKSSPIKKPQHTPSSPASQEYYSPSCDEPFNTIISSEFGDNNIDHQLPSFSHAIPMPIFASTNNTTCPGRINSYDSMNMNNWNSTASTATTWPMINAATATNLSINSLLLTAFQLRGHQHVRSSGSDNYSFNGLPSIDLIGSNNYNAASSSTGALELATHSSVVSEQHYDLDSNLWQIN